jgi:7,8-dihydropterin-6-yl-methyl-4-(beta-D-ribofuranosyl)aminobenzene 5'-phosphate synthase
MKINLIQTDSVEVVTLQDNTIDFFAFDENNDILQRPIPVRPTARGMALHQPPSAEHGWSSLIKIRTGDTARCVLFDFGWSQQGAAQNAKLLNIDLHQVDVLALSHGHIDHFGGIEALHDLIDRPDIDLVLHPAAFRNPRYGKVLGDQKIFQPGLTMEMLTRIGVTVVQTETPRPLLENACLFLTGIPRKTSFEKGMPDVFYLDGDEEKPDLIDDDAAMVVDVRGKGLVILSGCGHAGIINTIAFAREVTGVEKIHAVIGGFHLTGKALRHVIEPTIDALKQIHPDYIVPTHCTGRKAIADIERAMPDRFLLNMSGTTLRFTH